jgi:TIR domain
MRVFISHSHQDAKLAGRFEKLLKGITADQVDVWISSKIGSIEQGRSWIDWIHEQVTTAQTSFIFLTPSSFAGKWVLWEAGAVEGVRRMLAAQSDKDSAKERHVIPIRFLVPQDPKDLGPFQDIQVADGLNPLSLRDVCLAFQEKLRDRLDYDGRMKMNREGTSPALECDTFVQDAREILRDLPIHQREDLVLEWNARLDAQLAKNNPAFVRSARRWINIAFLGAAQADDKKTPIDFRLHSRLAEGFRRLKDWESAKEQLLLAQQLSPRDMLVLRELGRAELEANSDKAKARKAAGDVIARMKDYDPEVLKADEEALNLQVRILVEGDQWTDAYRVLSSASNLAQESSYVANMRAIAALKTGSPDAKGYFHELLARERSAKAPSIWGQGNMVNAALALGKAEEAERWLTELARNPEGRINFDSISRYFDKIVESSEIDYDWKTRWKALVQESEAASAPS